VLPGEINTPIPRGDPNVKSGAEMINKRDVGTPDDIAGAVTFRASDDAKFITGTALAVDGWRLTVGKTVTRCAPVPHSVYRRASPAT
jgi:NAD(P)-dependent dehydrogenase (short-subunit alcohol dehydrogenase family)